MLKGLFNIVVKEVKELVRDPKILLPMIIIPMIMFPLMGFAIQYSIETAGQSMVNISVGLMDNDGGPVVDSLTNYLKALNITIVQIEDSNISSTISYVQESNLTGLIVIPSGFSQNITEVKAAELEVYTPFRGEGIIESTRSSAVSSLVTSFEEALVIQKISEEFEKFDVKTLLNIGPAGEGLLFLYLAYRYLDDEGKLAFVLPKSVLSGASWFLIRTLLLEKCHLEYVIVSYDIEDGYNFSESTNLSEALIIARKAKTDSSEISKFIMLSKKPQTSFESKALAKAIINNGSYAEAGKAVAYINEVSGKELRENVDNWGRFVAFPDIKLLRFIKELNNGKLFGKAIPLTKLGKIATIGIDAHQFHDCFKKTTKKVIGSYPILWGGGEEQRTYLLGKSNSYALPVNEKADKMFEQKSSYLLIPDRIWLVTAHIISTFLPLKTLSNIFYAVKLTKHGSIKKYKALCVCG